MYYQDIDGNHIYSPFKYITKKPIRDLSHDQYLQFHKVGR